MHARLGLNNTNDKFATHVRFHSQVTMKVWNMVLSKYTFRLSLGIPCIFTSHHISGDEVLVWQVYVHMQSNLWSRYQLSGEPSVQTAWRHSHVELSDATMRLAWTDVWYESCWLTTAG